VTPCAPGGAIQIHGLLVHGKRHRRLDDRERPHRLLREGKGALVVESLQDLLDNRQARDDLLDVDNGRQIQVRSPSEDLDPRGAVNESQFLPAPERERDRFVR
jgi:hypothetical protein